MKIYLGADHRGFELKEKIKNWLSEWEYEFDDCGALSYDKNDDYPDFSKVVAKKVLESIDSRGILICGSGVGMSIAANRFKDIRAGLGINPDQIRDSVNDEDTNILTISADYTPENDVKEIVKSFLSTKFSGAERHIRRINKLDV
ncbi:MAG: RpiB/LacA/LacB family sugar-phosphate isomerase [Candidatus Zambryskibacteria bacterium]|nr:RpiB/LacA/LacB family sugar-phosphate isomerase [Candidatus Zambryskibacteria bacterium]